LAAQEAGEPALAAQAVSLSASRGWRDPAGQSALVCGALDGQHWRVAAERLDALQRNGYGDLVPGDVVQQLLSVEEGRDALETRSLKDRNWFALFLQMGQFADFPPELFAPTVQVINGEGAKLIAIVYQRRRKECSSF
jgi:hypothetical protein